jgi:hypothetical protein
MRLIVALAVLSTGCAAVDDTEPGYYPSAEASPDRFGPLAGAYELLLEAGDEWVVEMVSANVLEVRAGCPSDAPDLWTSYDDGVVWTCEHSDDRPGGMPPSPEYDGLRAGALAHEAGHGRPMARPHARCLDGEYVGEAMCDRDELGAVWAEVRALEGVVAIDDRWAFQLERQRDMLELWADAD